MDILVIIFPVLILVNGVMIFLMVFGVNKMREQAESQTQLLNELLKEIKELKKPAEEINRDKTG
jgi:hypothetical protein